MTVRLREVLILSCSTILVGAASSAGCTSFGATEPPAGGGAGGDGGGVANAGDSSPVDVDGGCDLARPFDPPVPVAGLTGPEQIDMGARFTSDELEAYVARLDHDDAGSSKFTIVRGTRSSLGTELSGFVRLSPNVPANLEAMAPTVTRDGRTMFLAAFDRAGGTTEIWSSALSPGAAPPQRVAAPVNEGTDTFAPYVIPDGSALYFSSARSGRPARIFRAGRGAGGAYDELSPVSGLQSVIDQGDTAPVVTPDELTIYWASTRTGASTEDLYTATRADKSSPFADPHPVRELNTTTRGEVPSFVSTDGCRLYFGDQFRQAGFESDILVATKPR